MKRKSFLRSLLGLAGAGLASRLAALPTAPAGAPALRDLGKTGLRVSALGLGATRTLEDALVRAAVDRGIRFIDTGRSYMNGRNEEMIGRALLGTRRQVVVQSKIKLPRGFPGGITDRQLTEHLERELGLSLKALRSDFVDVMLLHGVEAEPELENAAVREFFVRARAAGKIRACGFSAHRNHVALLETAVRDPFYEVTLLPFNPFARFRHSIGGWAEAWDAERLAGAMARAHAAGIAVVAMKTCSAGPYALRQGDAPSLAAAVRWVTDQPHVAAAVPAMASFTQLDEHLALHRS